MRGEEHEQTIKRSMEKTIESSNYEIEFSQNKVSTFALFVLFALPDASKTVILLDGKIPVLPFA
jgi:hypothetical protein